MLLLLLLLLPLSFPGSILPYWIVRGLEIFAQGIVFSSRSTSRLYQCDTLAISVLESETILLKDASFAPRLNLYICN